MGLINVIIITLLYLVLVSKLAIIVDLYNSVIAELFLIILLFLVPPLMVICTLFLCLEWCEKVNNELFN